MTTPLYVRIRWHNCRAELAAAIAGCVRDVQDGVGDGAVVKLAEFGQLEDVSTDSASAFKREIAGEKSSNMRDGCFQYLVSVKLLKASTKSYSGSGGKCGFKY